MPKPTAAAKKAQKKARTLQKAEKLEKKKDKKQKSKPSGRDADSDAESDVDLDAVLAAYTAQQERFLKVTETIVSEPPSARSSATLLANPANGNELLLFGGEYFNGAHARFYNDLYIYSISSGTWKLVTSPNSPLPRSGHAWTRAGNTAAIYLFGGEFSSPKQGTFYHYGDFWRLEQGGREWGKVEGKGKGPPARSGHRMTYFKQYIVLFGGFQDTSQTTKYLSDLWLYDCANFQWHQPALPPASQKPEPRSSFSFLPHETGAVLYGGYSRVKAVGVSTRQSKGGASFSVTALKPVVHQDTWFLRITPPPPEAPANTPPTVRWERRKRPANAPNPARAGATMAHHRGRGIQFGGVHDVEKNEEGIDSEFFNTLFVWNIDRNRYFSLALRRPKMGPKKAVQVADRGGRRGRGKADEEELLRNLAALETKGTLSVEGEEEAPKVVQMQEEDEVARVERPVMWEMPHPRFNAQLTVQDDVLYILGGTFEKGDREYTFDDMWAIDLGKLDGVKEIYRRELQDWQGSEEEDSEDEDDEGEEEDDDDDEEEEEADEDDSDAERKDSKRRKEKTKATAAPENSAPGSLEAASGTAEMDDTAVENTEPMSALNDGLPYPRPFESLRDFYARTSEQWQDILLQDASKVPQNSRSIKEVRKGAFERAEEKWWDCREEIRVLEDEQEEAGIGEVVSLADRTSGDASGGAGRRR